MAKKKLDFKLEDQKKGPISICMAQKKRFDSKAGEDEPATVPFQGKGGLARAS